MKFLQVSRGCFVCEQFVYFHTLREMATSLRLEDRMDGARNFVPWKARIVLILEENEL